MDVERAGETLANLSLSEAPKRHDSSSSRSRLPSGPGGDVTLGDQERFNKLVMKAKNLAAAGQIKEAVELNKKALCIYESEKLAKRVAKMEAYLKEFGEGEESNDENDADDGMVHVGNGFYLYKDLYGKLYTHQKAGVLWLWTLHKKGKGGILGDDMGLGKTIQVISFLSGLFDLGKVKSVLIVLPVSLMTVWEREIEKWAPGIRVILYHGTNKRERERGLSKIQRRGGVCLTTYGLVVSSWEKLSQEDEREYTWDYIILDEGHKIKNPTKTAKGVRAINARHRIILTGTPIQNNLQELWALFDFVHHGSLLGTSRTFKMEYDTPITRARERDATAGEKRLGMEMAESLKRMISPFFLRRTKAEVTAKTEPKDPEEDGEESSKDVQMPNLTRKNDLIVWLFLTDAQKKIYEDFISLDDVKELLMTHKSPLVALTVLKKLCDHPRLMSTRACMQLGLTTDEHLDPDDLESERGLQCAANRIQFIADDVLINESGKLIFLVELLDNLKKDGHRCLVFSQSTKMLNIIQKIITNRGHYVMRLDGSIINISEREERINKFQKDMRYSVFLLTTQVGGVGLTLTSADRVVIFDPSWNPATDAQAVDRVFRIGQDKNVVIYRLITCGTVEEKIYRRQIFKDSITRQTTGNSKNPYRYFTKQELRELFSLDNPHFSSTQKQLEQMHGDHRSSDTKLDDHIAYIHSLDIFGISDHDLMFDVDNAIQDEGNEMEEGSDYIQSQVNKAQQLLMMENNLPAEVRQQMEKPGRISDPDQTEGRNKPPKPSPSTYKPPENHPSPPGRYNSDVIVVDSPSPNEKSAQQQQHSESRDQLSEKYQGLSPDKDMEGNSSLSPDRIKKEEIDPDIQDMSGDEINEDVQMNELDRNACDKNEKMFVKEEVTSSPEGQGSSNSVSTPKGVLNSLVSYVKTKLTPKSFGSDSPKARVLNDSTNTLNVPPSPLSTSINQRTSKSTNQTPKTSNHTPKTSNHTPKTSNHTPKTSNHTPKTSNHTPKSANKTPLNKTPNRSLQRLVQEEIIISPDASRPIIKIEPMTPEERQPPCPPRRFRHNSSDPINAMFYDEDVQEPEPLQESPEPNPDLYRTFVPDTPDLGIRPSEIGKSPLRQPGLIHRSFTAVVDSVENSPAEPMESSRNMSKVRTVIPESDDEMVEDSIDNGNSKNIPDSCTKVKSGSFRIDTPELVTNQSGVLEDVDDFSDSDSNPDSYDKNRPSVSHSATKQSGINFDTPELNPNVISEDSVSQSEDSLPSPTPERLPLQKASRSQKKKTVQDISSDEDSMDAPQRSNKANGKDMSKKSAKNSKRLSVSNGIQDTFKKGKKTSAPNRRVSISNNRRVSLGTGKRLSIPTTKGKRNSSPRPTPKSSQKNKRLPVSKNTKKVEKSGKKGAKNKRRIVESDSSESETEENEFSPKHGKGSRSTRHESESEDEDGGNEEGDDSDGYEDSFIDDDNENSESEDHSDEEDNRARRKNVRKTASDAGSCEDEQKSAEDEDENNGSDENSDETSDGDFDEDGGSEDLSGEESCEDEEMPIPEHLQDKYFELEAKAHHLYQKKKYKQALQTTLEALEIYPEEGLQALALKLHQKLKR